MLPGSDSQDSQAQLLANADPERQPMMAQTGTEHLPLTGETWSEFPVAHFDLGSNQFPLAFGELISRWEYFSSLSQTKKIIYKEIFNKHKVQLEPPWDFSS